MNLLSKIRLFANLPEAELDELLSALRPQTLRPGEILFREGEPGETFYVVAKGTIEVVLGEGEADEMLLNWVGEGEYLGEMSLLLPGGVRTATARAKDDVALLCMTRAQFLELIKRRPELFSAMANVLSRRLDSSNAQSFRELSEKNRRLQAAYDELQAAQAQLIEKERMERELQLAADIQSSILPDDLPQAEEADFGARISPARQVGGDLYDVFQLSERQIGVLIGDVADKGVPSAIFMARAHALTMAEAHASATPGDTLRAVNAHITRLQKSAQFVTALYGIFDLDARAFSYARAGHEPPLLLRPDGEVARLPHSPGMALGLSEEITLDERSIVLPPGSALLLYTDGLTDCRSPQGEPFGLERVKRELAKLSQSGAQQICDSLLAALKAHQAGAKQDDDVTLVAIRAAGTRAQGAAIMRQKRDKM